MNLTTIQTGWQQLMAKKCCRCKAVKSTSEFHKCRSYHDGLQKRCKACDHFVSRRWALSDKGRASEAKRRCSDKRQAYIRAWQKRLYSVRPDCILARNAVYRAVRKGQLKRPVACDACGIPCRPQAHHHKGYDPDNRLDVVWLCFECHREADRRPSQYELVDDFERTLEIAADRLVDRYTRPLPLSVTDPDLDAAFRSIDVSKYRTPRGPSPFSRDFDSFHKDQEIIDGIGGVA